LRKIASLLLVVLAAPALVACGGDEKDAGDAPKPREPLSRFAARLQTALTQPNCPGLEEINRDGQFTLPCPGRDAAARPPFAEFRVRASKAYRTGGVIDYTAADAAGPGTMMVALGKDRRWVLLGPAALETTAANTQPQNQDEFREALDRFLPAVENRRCDDFFKYAVARTPNKEQACAQELGRAYEPLRRALKESDDAKPFFLGGNRFIMFYGLFTDEPNEEYRTVVVVRLASGAPQPFQVLTTARV
jgi:hypothetical protein